MRIESRRLLRHFLADAMTHAGQVALLRRIVGAPVPSENFIHARIEPANLGVEQALPAAPDPWWRADQGHRPPRSRPDARGGDA